MTIKRTIERTTTRIDSAIETNQTKTVVIIPINLENHQDQESK